MRAWHHGGRWAEGCGGYGRGHGWPCTARSTLFWKITAAFGIAAPFLSNTVSHTGGRRSWRHRRWTESRHPSAAVRMTGPGLDTFCNTGGSTGGCTSWHGGCTSWHGRGHPRVLDQRADLEALLHVLSAHDYRQHRSHVSIIIFMRHTRSDPRPGLHQGFPTWARWRRRRWRSRGRESPRLNETIEDSDSCCHTGVSDSAHGGILHRRNVRVQVTQCLGVPDHRFDSVFLPGSGGCSPSELELN